MLVSLEDTVTLPFRLPTGQILREDQSLPLAPNVGVTEPEEVGRGQCGSRPQPLCRGS